MSSLLLLGTGGGGAAGVNPATDPNCTGEWLFENATADGNGVTLLPDTLNTNDLEQLTGSLSPDVVTNGIQGDGTDDFLSAVSGGATLDDLFGAQGTILMVLKTPASISTNVTPPASYNNNEAGASFSGGRLSIFFLSGGPLIGFGMFDGAFKSATTGISLSTWYVVKGRYDGTDLGIGLELAAFTTATAGDLSPGAGTGVFRMHGNNNGTAFSTVIVNATYTFDTDIADATLDTYVEFLLSRKGS